MICPHCLGEFEQTYPRQEFCCFYCRKNASHMRQYHIGKEEMTESYIRRRDYNRERQIMNRERRINEGRCTRCGHEISSERAGMRTCLACSTGG